MSKVSDNLSVNAVKSLGYKSLKKAVVASTGTKNSKKRLIYDLKSSLDLDQCNDLFKSILNRFYQWFFKEHDAFNVGSMRKLIY